MIQHLTHQEIDKAKWDKCINTAINRLPYALSWWLDCVSGGWEALVMDDYKAVMPLPSKKKLGFDYLVQPFYTQQLGIFTDNDKILSDTNQFLKEIPSKYRLVQLQLNDSNYPSTGDLTVNARSNYILDLSKSYIELLSDFHRNCRRNVQKGKALGLIVEPGPDPTIFTRFIERNLEKSIKTSGNLFDILPDLMQSCIDRGFSETLGIYSHSELLAAGWFVHFHDRIFFMVCASTKKGKESHAMYALLDHVIMRHAGSGKKLDFTGSNMPGVAYFNEGFGAVKTQYPMITRNTLWWRRIIKGKR